MPVGGIKGCQRPPDAFQAQPAANVKIFCNILIVVKMNEPKGVYLAIDTDGCQHEKQAKEPLVSVGPIHSLHRFIVLLLVTK